MSLKVAVVNGDISKVSADALITAVNSERMWFGGIDGVIQRVAGQQFHEQLAGRAKLEHGQAFFIEPRRPHAGAFTNVIFVIDDLAGPLADIIFAGLVAANNEGLTSVTLPAIRTGVMLGVVEPNALEAMRQIAFGVKRFAGTHPATTLESVTFVIYNNADHQKLLAEAATKELVA